MANRNVVTSVKAKTASGYDTEVLFSVQQRYVDALLNSHNNNLEEQLLLGLDCITKEWDDEANNVHITVKRYWDGSNAPTGYYMLFSKNYGEGKAENIAMYAMIPVSGTDEDMSQGVTEGIVFLESSHAVWATDEETGDDLNRLDLNAQLVTSAGGDYKWNSYGGFSIDPGLIIIEEDDLYFRRDNSTSDEPIASDTRIARKETKQKFEGENPVKKIMTEIITNYLS